MQNWEKKGLIYQPDKKNIWSQSHAQVPVVDVSGQDNWRIYYATRDASNRSRTSYIEVKSSNPKEVIYEHHEPILKLGKIGTFDDSGIMPAWILDYNKKKYLFYIGWTTRITVPYHNAIGLAISEDGGKTFSRLSEGPLFGITYIEPYFTGTICVLIENGIWRCWYLSCTKWEIVNNKPEPFYHLKYAESKDGINWNRTGKVAIELKDVNEGGIASASVIKEDNIYKMWYSYRCGSDYRENKLNSYRIGYAESKNGEDWQRMDDLVNLPLSNDSWDSQMVAYPHVKNIGSVKYMFYNGNGFGKSGFGYAVLNE
ncbi:MAG: hypothetical protein JWP94_1104 [Mucilaginibacter sp.]|jgi:hypothetical protein|nr:hypothetical protein [Mucilaginibacter sp.]